MQGHRAFKWMGVIALGALGVFSGAAHHEGREALTPERFDEIKYEADELYNAKRFKEAFELYKSPLASNGDAYSQYMVGYMLRSGVGVKQDVPTGVAWMILAGQQGNLNLLEEANLAMAELSPGQERKADRTYRKLRQEYSKCALMEQLIGELKANVNGRGNARSDRILVVYGDVASDVPPVELERRLERQKINYKKVCNDHY